MTTETIKVKFHEGEWTGWISNFGSVYLGVFDGSANAIEVASVAVAACNKLYGSVASQIKTIVEFV